MTEEELFKDSACLPEEFGFYSTGSEIFYVIKSSSEKNYLVTASLVS